ncbi:bacterioferritin [Teredinibacter turnerae]|uniref:Bacterioferritin n=1 Tax=Teredinibacter turnerae (strain ATCC 39867 / T7901) TaxID=377629 RepID=C5BJP9_TERTT|nr:bacterioferritin [Teredinibacter turnerae]ACR14124.1 bacterioferritin [Teredinibacter turnerae T7901]
MQGKQTVIDALNQLLAFELTAMDQYFIHSEMYADWGLSKLQERIGHEFEDEKGHAQKLIARMLMLEGRPDMVTRAPINIGQDVPAMLQSDLNVEVEVAQALKETIELCEREQDYVTRTMLTELLDDTENDHAHWLEQQLGLIKKVGLKNYLQSQM